MRHKFIFYLISFVFLLSSPSEGSDGLVGYWPLNEGYGNIVYDYSFYKTNGTVYGAKWVKGKGGWALEFTKQSDFVSIPTRDILQLKDRFTISAWIYPFSVVEGNIVDMRSRYSGYGFSLNEGKLMLVLRTEDVIPSKSIRPGCGEFWFFSEKSVVEKNKWSYIAVSYNSEKDNIFFWVNGKRVKTSKGAYAAYCHSGTRPSKSIYTRGKITYSPYLPLPHLVIGCSGTCPRTYRQYKGLIREVKIYNKVLSDKDIKVEYEKNISTISQLKIIPSEKRELKKYTSLLKGKIIDADSGKRLEATVLVKVNNKYYISCENICWGRNGSEKQTGFISKGEFSLKIPPGKVHIEVTRGLEYLPFIKDFKIKYGEKKEIIIKLKRLVDMPSFGWWAGAHHEHSWGHGKGINYEKFRSKNGWKYYADAKKADGFNYVSHPAPWDGGDFKSTWTDRFICWPTIEDQVCHICTGYVGGGRDLVARMENLVKRGGHGLVQSYGGDLLQPGQVAIAMALDKIDAWQVNEKDWFKYLNLGFKSCIGQGSDYYFTYGFVRNMAREYSKMSKLSWENMIEAYKKHATFWTNGPLVIFKINGKDIGDTIILSGDKEEILKFSISGWCIYGLNEIEVIKNGKVVKRFSYSDKPKKVKEEFELKVNDTCWFLVRVYGKKGEFAGNYAITSPIYIQFGKNPMKAKKEDIEHFISCLLYTSPSPRD